MKNSVRKILVWNFFANLVVENPRLEFLRKFIRENPRLEFLRKFSREKPRLEFSQEFGQEIPRLEFSKEIGLDNPRKGFILMRSAKRNHFRSLLHSPYIIIYDEIPDEDFRLQNLRRNSRRGFSPTKFAKKFQTRISPTKFAKKFQARIFSY